MTQNVTLKWHGKRAGAIVEAACRRGVTLWGESVLEGARRIVPLDEAILSNSGAVTPSADGRTATVSFDTPYAVRQHEETTYRHLPGRTAKYLEKPWLASQRIGLRLVANQIRRATG